MTRLPSGRELPPHARPISGLLGLLAAALLVSLSPGCGGDDAPITAESSKYQAADETPAAPGPGASVSPAGSPAPTGTSEPAAPEPSATTPAVPLGDATPAATSAPPSNPEPNDTPADAPPKPSATPPGTPPQAAAAKSKAAATISEIVALQRQDPRGATQEETLTNVVKLQRQVISLANQVLGETATDAELQQAAQFKLQALMMLSQIQREAQPELEAFMSELKRSPQAILQRLGDRLDFAQQLDRFASGDKEDAAKVLARFQKLFEEEPKDAALFTLSQQVTEAFLQNEKTDLAISVMKLVSETFEKSKEQQLTNAAKMVREQVVILEVSLDDKVQAVIDGKPMADVEFLAVLDKLFGDRELGQVTQQFMARVLYILESNNIEVAAKGYEKMIAAFEKHSTPELLKEVRDSAEKFGKRRALLGKPFVVEGLTLEGKPFDWKAYQGKVVLVDFWATWCRPCLAEIPNIKQNYEQYRALGFEVVGVNVDEDPAALQRFFSVQKLPWTTVVSPDPQKVGFEHPMLVQCGVEGIPFLVLVDRDGKAIALNLRGEELGKKLATMFASKPPETPAK